MYFTQEDYNKIREWLLRNSVKDTEFPTTSSVTDNDTISIVQNGENKKLAISRLIGFLNSEIEGSGFTKGTALGSVILASGGGNANGNMSLSLGKDTLTTNESETALGKFNRSNKDTIHSVGIGNSSLRKNAQEIDINGKHYIYGIGNYDGTNIDNATDLACVFNKVKSTADLFTQVSIVGDSISTYEYWIPEGYNSYYPKTNDSGQQVNSVSQTYWYDFIYRKLNNAYLGINNSLSGSLITRREDSSYKGLDFCSRIIDRGLGNPDIVIIYGGANDCTKSSSTNKYKVDLWNGAEGMAPGAANCPSKAYLDSLCNAAHELSSIEEAVSMEDRYFVNAYIKMLTLIRVYYPGVKIISVIPETVTKNTHDSLLIILKNFNVKFGYTYVDFFASEGYNGNQNITKIAGVHPDSNGFKYIANVIYNSNESYIYDIVKYNNPIAAGDGKNSIILKNSGAYAAGVHSSALGADNIYGKDLLEGDKLEHVTATGYAAHAEGAAHALGDYSHAEGGGNTDVTSEGYCVVSTAEGECSHAEGTHTHAIGGASHAEGNRTKAVGSHSHAEGRRTAAEGSSSHAEGKETIAYGLASHAEGENVTASGEASHAEGYNTTASGKYSHAEGNKTIASGTDAHAEGKETQALAANSHAEGYNTVATNSFEHAEGKCNKSNTNTIHSVGIGTSNTNRKNAFEIMDDGRMFIIGIGGYDGTNPNTSKTIQEIINELTS